MPDKIAAYADFVELGLKARDASLTAQGKPSDVVAISREFIVQAVSMIERGEVEAERFISGAPDPQIVYALALKLEQNTRQAH